MSRAVKLSARDKEYLQEILNKGKHSARKLKRVRILLLLSEGSVAKEIAEKAGTGVSTVYKIWNRYFEEGKNVKKAIEESTLSGQPPKLTATVKAHVTAIACSQWTLKMISEKVAELGYVKKIRMSLDLLFRERGFEFYGEMLRRTDMIRFGKYEDTWTEKTNRDKLKRIFPIPQNAIDGASSLAGYLVQNEGY